MKQRRGRDSSEVVGSAPISFTTQLNLLNYVFGLPPSIPEGDTFKCNSS